MKVLQTVHGKMKLKNVYFGAKKIEIQIVFPSMHFPESFQGPLKIQLGLGTTPGVEGLRGLYKDYCISVQTEEHLGRAVNRHSANTSRSTLRGQLPKKAAAFTAFLSAGHRQNGAFASCVKMIL